MQIEETSPVVSNGFAQLPKKSKSDDYECFMDVQDPPSAFEEYNLSKNKSQYSTKPQKSQKLENQPTPWFSKNKENTVVLN